MILIPVTNSGFSCKSCVSDMQVCMKELNCAFEAQGSLKAFAVFVEKVCKDPGQCVCSYQAEFTHCQQALTNCQTLSTEKSTTKVTERSTEKVIESQRSTGAPCIERVCAPCVIQSHLVDCPVLLKTCQKDLSFLNLSKNGSQGQVDSLVTDLALAVNSSAQFQAELTLCQNKSLIR